MLQSNSFSDSFFTKMVDELVFMAEFDEELEINIKWVDAQAQKKGLTFYEMVFDILYRHDINSKASKWLNDRYKN